MIIAVLLIYVASEVLGMATLTLPKIVNCGDQVVLVCTSTNCTKFRFLRENATIYNDVGPQYGIDTSRYALTRQSDFMVQLTISNLQRSDAGSFKCSCSFDITMTWQTMQYECKARNSTVAVMPSKTLAITVDMLYPEPSNIIAALTTSQLLGTYTCESSHTLDLHYRCTWVSSASLPDGLHSYTITVTTGTQAAQVYGGFSIVTPTSPTIFNMSTISNNRQALRGVQDIPLTIRCVSRGGIPAPTLAWYRGNTSTFPLAQSSTSDSVQQSDGTYIVSFNHTFVPTRTDDMTAVMCRVFYPGSSAGTSPVPSPASAILYLILKPEILTVLQTGDAVSGEIMILRCISANGRPAPSITWFYRDQTFTPTNTSSCDSVTETCTVVSVLQREVSAEDNGQTATCIVSHTIFPVAFNGTVIVDVKFSPLTGSTRISGNKATPATASYQLQLNCTSGSSNPVSNLTWYNRSVILTSGDSKRWSGANNGYITSNILTFTPTRYMDGDSIVCRADNGYGSDSIYVDLDILYSPLIQLFPNLIAVEGESDLSLICSASSKPPASFTWYKGNIVLTNGTGTHSDNSFSYVIPFVDRTHAGSYECQASNNIETKDSKNMTLIVQYPPKVSVSVSNTTQPSYTITCTAVGYPDNYTYQDWIQIWPGYGPVATIPFTGTTITFTDHTYERSGVYVCGASNGIALYGKVVKYIEGNATISIKAPPVLTDPSPDGTRVLVAGRLGHDSTTKIKYWSNANGSVVKCYKHVGDSRSASSSCSFTETDTEVTLPVHNRMVPEIGKLAIIKIHILNEEDMTAYDVVFSNSVQGESVLGITIVPRGPPEAPTLTGNFSIASGQVIVTVVPGFHGGYNQTLVVQISTDLKTWSNNTSVSISQDSRPRYIHFFNLQGNALHLVRVFAFNIEGKSKYSVVLNFTTAEDKGIDSPASFPVGQVVGAVTGVCVIILIAVVVVIFWRIKDKGAQSKSKETRRFAKDRDSSDGVVECALYESAGPSVSCQRDRQAANDDLYAVVSKPKQKGPVEEKEFAQDNKDVSENAPELATAGNVCNNPKSKNANKDGLTYADLEFNNNPKESVIHGLDDVTTYVQVDFTKAADPLPDSDEEIHSET